MKFSWMEILKKKDSLKHFSMPKSDFLYSTAVHAQYLFNKTEGRKKVHFGHFVLKNF